MMFAPPGPREFRFDVAGGKAGADRELLKNDGRGRFPLFFTGPPTNRMFAKIHHAAPIA
jgi:hypothetical protein